MNSPLEDILEGKYEILEKIGEGGIGAVYKVRHRLLEEIRVVKVLRPQVASKEDLQERFLHEARMAIKLKHPNIAQLHDFSIGEDARAYIVMEFIDGVGLDTLLEATGPPSVDMTLEISRQALSALDYLHAHQFIHRDVSPDNLMLTASFDGSPLVKLIDLGIARHLGSESRLTATGVFVGKARYCSPEQFSAGGENDVEMDRRGDLYSYGVLLYELLTGIHPFRGESFAELAGSHLFQPPRAFDETDPDGRVPAGLREVVLRALEKEPDRRFATATEFSAELERFRDPDYSFQEEFDHTIEITTTTLPSIKDYPQPGSTQNRLDREFGYDKTPSPATAAAGARRQITAVASRPRSPEQAAQRIQGLLKRGRRRRAARSLAKALAQHGEAPPLLALQEQLSQTVAGDKRPWALVAAGAAAMAIAVGAGLWWGLRAQPIAGEASTDATATLVLVSETPRWDPATVGLPPVLFLPEGQEVPGELPSETAESESGAAALLPEEARPEGGVRPGTDPSAPAAETGSGPSAAPDEPALAVSQEIFEPGVGVILPVLLELPEVAAPEGARRLREELTIAVEVLVDETGRVLTARIADGPSFRRRFRDAALEAAKLARFRPARKGNTVGRMWAEVRVTFKAE